MCGGRIFHLNSINAKKAERNKIVFAFDIHRDQAIGFAVGYGRDRNAARKSGKRTFVGDQFVHKGEHTRIIILQVDQGGR